MASKMANIKVPGTYIQGGAKVDIQPWLGG